MSQTDPSKHVASMAAGRRRRTSPNDPPPPPRADRDGFDLISQDPIHYDIDLTQQFQFTDIRYRKSTHPDTLVAEIAFDRPHVLHAFRPTTIQQVQAALQDAIDDPNIAVIILTSTSHAGTDPHNKDTDNDASSDQQATASFCAGGDQTVRDNAGGYMDDSETQPKLRVLDLQVQMRTCPKPIMAVVRGYAIGGGHILHMMCDLTLCSDNAIFGQTGPRMGSFDAGYGCIQGARLVGQKKIREIWFLSKFYTAQEALSMGLVNAVFADDTLNGKVGQWVRRMCMNSPTALAACKAACNAADDGAHGILQMGHQLTRLYYISKESQEGRDAFLEKRKPDFRSKL